MLKTAIVRKNKVTGADTKTVRARGAIGSEQSFAVVLVVIIVLLVAILGLSMMTMAMYQSKDADRTRPSNRAFDLAQAGLAYGHAYLAQDNIPPDGTPDFVGGGGGYSSPINEMVPDVSEFQVYVWKDTVPPLYNVRSVGTYKAKEGSEVRPYVRTLEERVSFSGSGGYFDCFNYLMFSKAGSVNIDSGWKYGNYTGMNITGNIYANNVTLSNIKTFVAKGTMTVNGNVYAKNNATVYAKTTVLADADVDVKGSVAAGQNVSVKGESFATFGATALVEGDVLAGGRADLEAHGTVLCGPRANCNGDVKSNGGSSLKALNDWWAGWSSVNISGSWIHPENTCSPQVPSPPINVGGHAHASNPLTLPVVPEIDLPQPDWKLYRTWAHNQGNDHLNSGPYTIDKIESLSSGDIYYFDNDLTITNLKVDVNCKGVIVCEGNVTVKTSFQLKPAGELQVIAMGDITFQTFSNLSIDANATVFFYTNGTKPGINPGSTGNITYDLGWFRDIYGQFTCTGDIVTPSAGVVSTPIIKYKAPVVPIEAWPIPMQILRFREL